MRKRNTQVFIVKVWKEGAGDEGWRGNIQNVRTGQCITAPNANELAEFIRRCFEQSAQAQPKLEKGLR